TPGVYRIHHCSPTRRSSDLASIELGTLERLPVTNRRKAGMTSNHHAPYDLGYTRATMAGTTGCEGAIRSQSLKAGLSSNCRLQRSEEHTSELQSRENLVCAL